MSPALPKPPKPTDASPPPAPAAGPRFQPRLPVVQFRSQEPRMQVYFSARKAATAAQAASNDKFYDVRGIVLTRVQGPLAMRLEAHGAGKPGALKRRMMKELRRGAKLAAPNGQPTAGVAAVLDWLESAPSPAYLVHGLALTEELDDTAPGTIPSGRCRKCNWVQKWYYGTPPCCPG